VHLVYYAAFLPQQGQSLRDITGATPESVPIEDGYMIIDEQLKALYAPLVYSDMPVEEGLEWFSKMKEHSSVSFDGKLTHPAYKYIPVTYLICEDDKVIAPELQRKMVETARKQSTMDIDVISCTAGHGVNVSKPEAVIKAIVKAVSSGI
jgi:pimeloyl-ACP methyl ester carboxylesterase